MSLVEPRQNQSCTPSTRFIVYDHHMASQQSVDIQVISDGRALTYVDVATLALLTYDTLLTLPSEITYLWHRRVRLGTVLYLLARYPTFLFFIFTSYIGIANIPLESVQSIGSSHIFSRHCGTFRCRRLLLARVYAMSQHKGMRWVLGAFGLLLYMGSFGSEVLIAVRNTCNPTAHDMGAIIS
ncbi:hypothetical protein JB92DRAFT_1895966 [Gautieria morchelliformis]|nr:hypothetical protein JB92DRAFT_1895966 [Gautieria morchelliformis]